MKSGIKILSDTPGTGPEVRPNDRVVLVHSCYLSKGGVIYEARKETVTLSDRENVAGFRYGIEGMQAGGQRKYQASPHLCYGEAGVPGKIPPNALLVFDVTLERIL
jgi:FKBP-type peptidyl-prolyl cis-trans isomerase